MTFGDVTHAAATDVAATENFDGDCSGGGRHQTLRVAVFAEGSANQAFTNIWQRNLPALLGVRSVAPVIPINKKHLLAMDSKTPTMSGSAEPLDELMARTSKSTPFDAAIIAWDLYPMWAGRGTSMCRWIETVALFEALSLSRVLDTSWVTMALNKYNDLLARPTPSHRAGPPKVAHHGIYALCMDSEFESLLVADEQSVRRALGIDNLHIKDWPKWKQKGRPDPVELLNRALDAVKAHTPRPASFPKIRDRKSVV